MPRTKIWIVLSICGLLVVALAIGCGDEKCPSCPATVTPRGYAYGSIWLDPGVILPEMRVYGYGAVAPNLDSVKVGDSIVDKWNWSLASTWPYSDAYWMIHFFESGDVSTHMYHHGDTATVSIWGEGKSSTCRVKILDPDIARATITTPLMGEDTIAPGVADTVYWNDVDYADYYAIMVPFNVITGGGTMWTFYYDYTLDTFYTVTGAMQPDSLLYYDIVVTPFNGPDPRTGAGNWTGNLLTGKLYSSGGNVATRIFIDNVFLPSDKARLDVPENRPEWTAGEIIRKVYEKYESQDR
jgi:hypothetical protein